MHEGDRFNFRKRETITKSLLNWKDSYSLTCIPLNPTALYNSTLKFVLFDF